MKTFICKNVDYYLYFLKVNILQFNNSGILGMFDESSLLTPSLIKTPYGMLLSVDLPHSNKGGPNRGDLN